MHSSTKREQFIAHAVPSLSDTIQIYLRAIPSGRPVGKKIGISGLSAGITILFVLMGNVSAGYGAPQPRCSSARSAGVTGAETP